MSDDDNLIPFPRGQFEKSQNVLEATLDELPVRTKHTAMACNHVQHGIFVDPGARTVTCRGCGCPIDPIDALTGMARRRENLVMRGRALRHEVDSLTERVERLKKDEHNAKSRIRTARRRRDDRGALVAAAGVTNDVGIGLRIGGYQPWDQLSEPQRGVVLGYVQRIVEAYAGALSSIEEREVAS